MYFRFTELYPRSSSASFVLVKSPSASGGTTTLRTLKSQSASGVVTNLMWRLPPVSAALAETMSSTRLAQNLKDGRNVSKRSGTSLALTYITWMRLPVTPEPPHRRGLGGYACSISDETVSTGVSFTRPNAASAGSGPWLQVLVPVRTNKPLLEHGPFASGISRPS